MLPIMLDLAQESPELELTLTFREHLIDPIEEGVDLAVPMLLVITIGENGRPFVEA